VTAEPDLRREPLDTARQPLDIVRGPLDPERGPRPLDPDALTVLSLPMHDPRVRPLLDELAVEYDTRYGDLFGREGAAEELNRYPAEEFAGPGGALLVIQENGESIAGGAFRRYDDATAELKRIWTHSAHRRRGLARLVLAELEALAVRRGYTRLYLTTGPRQPEAKHLYLTTGYEPQFDLDADPETIKFLAFTKDLSGHPQN
jgi:GNAT superfamily N-acetyltransferase